MLKKRSLHSPPMGGLMSKWICASLSLLLVPGMPAFAETPPSLADLSLEQLMNESVTSVSKKETKLTDSPAAITVITPEDIRRTGATSIPDALRMVPGLDVARINGGEWAVSSRGFNGQYATKLLVLVDGRSVYTPSTSGVFWGMQDVMMEDLDRIEVIRGPGATLWGANAVNGVINIMTKSARDTQGFLGSVTYGTELQPLASLRYGGQIATNLYYRVYGQFLNQGNLLRSDHVAASDRWLSARTGLRLDWQPSEQNHFTFQGDYNSQKVDQSFNEPHLTPTAGVLADVDGNHNSSANVLGRWTHTYSADSESSLQIYYDTFKHLDAGELEERDTFDLDWQHHFSIGQRNDLIWGLGYRYTPDNIVAENQVSSWQPQRTHQQFFSAFLQDEIKLVPDKLKLTLGTKLERNDYTGIEIQPSGRLQWEPTGFQTVWGAVSRATRTPNRFENGGRINSTVFQPPLSPPIEVALLPSADLTPEKVISYELGYRIRPAKRISFDVTAFYNTYDNLHTFSRGPTRFEATPTPHLLIPLNGNFDNAAKTYGTELQSQWQVTDSWRLMASYSWLHLRLDHNDGSQGDSPEHQFNVRSYWDITKDLELNAAAYYVDQTLHSPDRVTIIPTPAYVRLDVGLTWRATKNLDLSVWGQNLLQDRHSEITSFHASFLTEMPRSVYGKITLHF